MRETIPPEFYPYQNILHRNLAVMRAASGMTYKQFRERTRLGRTTAELMASPVQARRGEGRSFATHCYIASGMGVPLSALFWVREDVELIIGACPPDKDLEEMAYVRMGDKLGEHLREAGYTGSRLHLAALAGAACQSRKAAVAIAERL
jgi:hypothetical protein